MLLIKAWPEIRLEALSIRYKVFVDEQGVPIEMEEDEVDANAIHAIYWDQQRPIATARIYSTDLSKGSLAIGRMAVLKEYRNLGIGSLILRALIDHGVSRQVKQFELHAQEHAVTFYTKFGFISDGELFNEAGIPHQKMLLTVA